jgi:aminoglycoside 3-N-acetyltransferase
MSPEFDAVSTMLDEAGVPPEGILVVHSGFRGLSRAGYRAEPFIEALLERMKGGNLLMPAMSWRIVTPEQPVWDELATSSHVGVLTEIFRTCYAQHRSIHPTHSVCAYGPATLRLLDGHHLDDTPCSANSPWGRLAESGAHILLLGIGFERCTALHHPEEILAASIYLEAFEDAGIYRCRARDGTVYDVRFRRHYQLDRDFSQYAPRLNVRGRLKSGDIAGVRWMAVSARNLMEDAFANLTAQRDAHIKSHESGSAG